jgi:hypothetical protein
MRLLKLVLFSLLLAGAALADTKKVKEPSIDNTTTLQKWIKERVKNAADGKPELVRFPIVGCIESATCPSYWAIGFSDQMEDEDQDKRWILPITDGIKLPVSGWVGGVATWGPVLLVEGYFTGVKRVATNEEGFADKTKLAEFKVLRFTNASQTKAERLLKIVATGDEVTKVVDPFTDDKSWLVLASSKLLSDATSQKVSDELKEKLIAAGFTEAEVFDSRKAKNLFCCYLTVTAGRYKTKEDAQAAVKKVKAKGFDAYAKQGW